jgi:Flp pilus assembly protein TadG
MADLRNPLEPSPEAAVPRPLSPPRRARRLLRRFGRNKDGVAAVEFALIAVPFFMLMVGTVELALILWTNQMMDEAVMQASRTILTGEARALYPTPATATAQFRTVICDNLFITANCQSRLQVDVQTFGTFGGATVGQPVSGGNFNTAGWGFRQAGPSQVVVVRAALQYPMLLSTWNRAFGNLADGSRALISSVAFQTEPF